MGSTFVTLGRNAAGSPTSDDSQHVGFWMRDSTLELWLRLLALHIKDPDQPGDLANAIRNKWLLASRIHFMGCVPHFLAEATATAEGFALVDNAVRSLSSALEGATDKLCGGTLNLMGFDDGWDNDVDVAALREAAAKFRDLLDGKLSSKASDTR
jgi:hypothetical protein